jgi:hypothetical protein
MTTFTFNEPWGFVKNGRDERGILTSFRRDLDFIGWSQRFSFFRDHVMRLPGLARLLTPQPDSHSGIGYLIKQAGIQVNDREKSISQGLYPENPDFLQQ